MVSPMQWLQMLANIFEQVQNEQTLLANIVGTVCAGFKGASENKYH